ncbi:MAG: SDR family NAD(P)-dependent oxidoreductase [Clostridia bacterium]|nr:SDR family NAD(P)-dependent oxidoreductase [Clostridia bacterium]
MAYTFISGATGGIGKAFSYECAKKGYDLFLTGRNQQKLDELAFELQSIYHIKTKVYACDLTDSDKRRGLIDYARSQCTVFDRIIHVAGVDVQKAFMDYTVEKVSMQLQVNAVATVELTHGLLQLKDTNTEVIVISSMSGVSPMPYFALYSATKSMLTNFFTALHYELKGQGVKVTCVLPGGVPTREDVKQAIKEQGFWGRISAKSPEFVAQKSLKAVKRNKVKYIPGFFNKALNFIMKIAPKGLVLRFIARRWKKLSKDAF